MSKINPYVGFTNSKFNNFFLLWENIENNPQEKQGRIKKILAITNPELAFELYKKFVDRELGEILVENYKDFEEYKEDVYFISSRVGMPIERENPSDIFDQGNSYDEPSIDIPEKKWESREDLCARIREGNYRAFPLETLGDKVRRRRKMEKLGGKEILRKIERLMENERLK